MTNTVYNNNTTEYQNHSNTANTVSSCACSNNVLAMYTVLAVCFFIALFNIILGAIIISVIITLVVIKKQQNNIGALALIV